MIPALRALALGVADLFRPRVFAVLAMGVALTLGLFILLQALAFWALRAWGPESIALPWIGSLPIGEALSWGSLALFPLMSLFLAAPVAAGFAGLFSEQVSETVEAAHGYPRGTSLGLLDGLAESLLVIGAVVVVSIAVLILTPFIGPLAPILFYAANGWLLGREFFQMVARRHLPAEDADRLRQRRPGAVVTLGIGVALLLTVPLLNILVPVLAAAAYTHLFHIVSARRG
ncbi:EI24 domain-containing protein [Paracoccus sp. MC1862]|uniref:EI24 domain-containing protein n=1 Tax=Paracoccus sp. MC1862 TaxID=2760307 RepID=UPI001F3C5DB7|nr:EI24 domain-containing protein [Paracoccus sp. MC1862]